MARDGAAEGLWLRAERQTGGRGRQGREWRSPAGNLYASTLPCLVAVADGVVVGSAIVKLIEQNGSSSDCAAKLEAFVKPLVAAVKALA